MKIYLTLTVLALTTIVIVDCQHLSSLSKENHQLRVRAETCEPIAGLCDSQLVQCQANVSAIRWELNWLWVAVRKIGEQNGND